MNTYLNLKTNLNVTTSTRLRPAACRWRASRAAASPIVAWVFCYVGDIRQKPLPEDSAGRPIAVRACRFDVLIYPQSVFPTSEKN